MRKVYDWRVIVWSETDGLRFRYLSHRDKAFAALEGVNDMRFTQGAEQRTPTIPDEEQGTVAERTQPDAHCNPFVGYLNSLRSVTAGSENALVKFQSVSRFFGYIHKETVLN